MYYRRKILLSLLQTFGGKLGKLELQKLLFLFVDKQASASFHFIPYKYGCYSFQANADLSTLSKYGLVKESNKEWLLTTSEGYDALLIEEDKKVLQNISDSFKSYSTNDLIIYVYKRYPYYAINSLVAEEKLSTVDYNKVKQLKPQINDPLLFTIGYEGISVEEYFNKLIQNDVKVLCDVRNFPRSMKYGFSKNQLKSICEGLGIKYVHLPGLGIVSTKRKKLETQEDYDNLFTEYRETTLINNSVDQKEISRLISQNKRVAITCFESNIHQCHRFHLANALNTNGNGSFILKHI